ncbi:MAG: DUF1232 domain-containing protein [Dehalogenimonas sp.]
MQIFSKLVDWISTPYTILQIIKDPTVTRGAKLRSTLGLAVIFLYIVSPIDIISDFIPLSGWIDDAAAIPLGLALIRKMTPDIGILERREKAQRDVKRVLTRITVIVIFVALMILAILVIFLFTIFKGLMGS